MYKINRYWHKCKWCGNKNGEYYLQENGHHYGLYCGICNRWVKWIKKNEMLHITGNKNVNKVYNKNNEEITVYNALHLEEPKSLSELQDVSTLTEEEINKLNLPF